MSNLQFVFACIAALSAILGGCWIFAQSMHRTRTHTEQFQATLVESIRETIQALSASKKNPEYESRFQEGDRRMDEMSRQVEFLQAGNLQTQKDMAVQIHSLNNLKQRFEGIDYALNSLRDKIDEMPQKIVRLLRGINEK